MDTHRSEVPKRIKRLLREHAAVALEEELRRALLPLAAAFHKWEQGQITSGALSQLIYEFHQGPARELFGKYDSRLLKPAVGYAIASGVLRKADVPADLLEHLAGMIEYYEAEGSKK